MPRFDEMESFIGRRVRAISLRDARIEGTLNSVAHIDIDDVLLIGEQGYRLGNLKEVYLLEEGVATRLWPPVAPGEDVSPPPPEVRLPYDPVMYDLAVSFIGRMVAVTVAGQEIVGTLEAISSKTDVAGPQVHVSVAEGAPTTVVQLSSVTHIAPVEALTLPPLRADELERDVLPTSELGYPFEGRATTSKPLAAIAGQVLLAAEEFGMPAYEVLDHACRHYNLDSVGRQSLQAMLARLQELKPTELPQAPGSELYDGSTEELPAGVEPTGSTVGHVAVEEASEEHLTPAEVADMNAEAEEMAAAVERAEAEEPSGEVPIEAAIVVEEPKTTAIGPLLAEDTVTPLPAQPEWVPAEANVDAEGAFGFGTSGPEGEGLVAEKTRPPEDPPKPKKRQRKKKGQ